MSECPAFCIVVFIHQQVVVGVEDPLHDIVRCLTWPNKLLPQISPPQLLSLSSVRPWSAVRPVHLGFTFLGFTKASGKRQAFFSIHSPSKAGLFHSPLCKRLAKNKKKTSTFSQEYCMDTNKSSSRLDSGKPKKNMECIDLTYKSNVSCTIEPFFQTDLHHLPEMLHLVNDTGCMPIVPGCCASYKSHPLALRKRQLHRHQPSEFTISGLTLNVHFEL